MDWSLLSGPFVALSQAWGKFVDIFPAIMVNTFFWQRAQNFTRQACMDELKSEAMSTCTTLFGDEHELVSFFLSFQTFMRLATKSKAEQIEAQRTTNT